MPSDEVDLSEVARIAESRSCAFALSLRVACPQSCCGVPTTRWRARSLPSAASNWRVHWPAFRSRVREGRIRGLTCYGAKDGLQAAYGETGKDTRRLISPLSLDCH